MLVSESYEQVEWGRPEPRPGRRKLLLVGGLAVLLLAGGAVAAVLLLGGSDSRLVGGADLPRAVTEAPEEQWTWSPGDPAAAVAVGDVLVVNSGEQVTALDEDGEELWTSAGGGGIRFFPEHEDVVFVSGEDRLSAFSMDDGEEIWSLEHHWVAGAGEEGLLVTDFNSDELSVLDPETGEEQWSVEGVDNFVAFGEAAYVLDGSELTRLSFGSGEEEWSVDTGFESDPESVRLYANEEMVVLRGDEVMAIDVGDGDELWVEGGFEATVEVGVYSRSRVYLSAVDHARDVDQDSDVTVYDREGEVGDLELDEGDYFAGLPFEMDGTSYLLNYATGAVYDENLEELGQYDGDLTLVEGGLYTLARGELSFYEIGSSTPAWSIDTRSAASDDAGGAVWVVALDGRLVLVSDDEFVSYQ